MVLKLTEKDRTQRKQHETPNLESPRGITENFRRTYYLKTDYDKKRLWPLKWHFTVYLTVVYKGNKRLNRFLLQYLFINVRTNVKNVE